MDDGFYKRLLDNIYDGVYYVDPSRMITYWNKGAERISGYASKEVVGKRCLDNILVHVDDSGTLLCLGDCPLKCSIDDGKERETEAFLQHKDGYRIPVAIRTSPIKDAAGKTIGGLEVFSDNTNMLSARTKLSKMELEALTDSLTGLYNRRYLDVSINSLFHNPQQKTNAALLFLDIDHFKHVNDTYGHAAGDQVLVTISNALKHNTRSTDMVGRWGGEEFMVLVTDIDADYLAGVANKLRIAIQESKVQWGETKIKVTVSIGATKIIQKDNPSRLIRRVDELLYQSKFEGRNRVTIG